MKVLVTGATGFVGRALTDFLSNQGLDVRVLVRPQSSTRVLDQRLEFVSGDILDLAAVTEACRGVDSVFHLAGLVDYRSSARKTMERINVIGTANVIQACRSNDVRRLLHFSSVVAVGASLTPTDVLDESSAYNVGRWDLGYFETKRKAERLVKDCVEAGQLDAVIVNPSTIYGASDAEKGSRGVQVKVARGRMPFFTIGGASIIDIDSVVQATFAAWRSGRSGERYILSGENLTIEDIFGLIAKAAGVAPPSHCLPTWLALSLGRCGDIVESLGGRAPLSWESARVATLYHWFKNDKARAELGLRPLPAATAIENSVRWMKERGLLDG